MEVQLKKLRPVPLKQVTIDDRFWAPRLETNRKVTIPTQLEQIKKTGRLDNLLRAAGRKEGDFEGFRFNDSDVHKWLDAASTSLATHPDPELERRVDEVIEIVGAAQEDSGYLNSAFTVRWPEHKWENLSMNHELYTAGHLIEAAVTHHYATGKRTLLDIALRLADHIHDIFGPGKRDGTCGHEEIELALFKLYEVTGDERWPALSQRFLDLRGRRPSVFEPEFEGEMPWGNIVDSKRMFFKGGKYDGSYCQDHLPVREQSEVVGHAVRAMYLFCGMTDAAARSGDQAMLDALDRLWRNLTEKRMYIHGGIGPAQHNEGFTADYDLPNDTAYAETCAALGLVFWAHRMALLHGDAQYADVMEQALYNGALSGISYDGKEYFYMNPLAADGTYRRVEWFPCSCCPPNIARVLAGLGQYLYAQSESVLAANLYIAGSCTTKLRGVEVKVTQRTDYPWDGAVGLIVEPTEPVEFELWLRVPRWCRAADVSLNEGPLPIRLSNGYIVLDREWQRGDRVQALFGMGPERVISHPNIRHNAGRVAVRRGPIVYCLEDADHETPVTRLHLPMDHMLDTEKAPDLPGEPTVIRAMGLAVQEDGWRNTLYRSERQGVAPTHLRFVPYYLWANRAPGAMEVWAPVSVAQGGLGR